MAGGRVVHARTSNDAIPAALARRPGMLMMRVIGALFSTPRDAFPLGWVPRPARRSIDGGPAGDKSGDYRPNAMPPYGLATSCVRAGQPVVIQPWYCIARSASDAHAHCPAGGFAG